MRIMVIEMRKKLSICLLCLGIVIFLGAGAWLAVQCVQTTSYYQTAITQAEQALAAADPSTLAPMEAELDTLLESNAKLQESLVTAQEENAVMAEEEAQLQQDYEALSQEMDAEYYHAILESLTEGMSRVEEYINGR